MIHLGTENKMRKETRCRILQYRVGVSRRDQMRDLMVLESESGWQGPGRARDSV